MTEVAAGSDYRSRLRRLETEVEGYQDAVDVIEDGRDTDTADEVVSEGLGPTVSLYVEHRTGGTMTAFTPSEMRRLERTLNAWLEVYCRCYGFDLEFDYTVREAAEILVETHDARAVAEVLTKVP